MNTDQEHSVHYLLHLEYTQMGQAIHLQLYTLYRRGFFISHLVFRHFSLTSSREWTFILPAYPSYTCNKSFEILLLLTLLLLVFILCNIFLVFGCVEF